MNDFGKAFLVIAIVALIVWIALDYNNRQNQVAKSFRDQDENNANNGPVYDVAPETASPEPVFSQAPEVKEAIKTSPIVATENVSTEITVPPAPVLKADPKAPTFDSFHHSPDFRVVTHNGETHSLTLYQSRAVEKLWKARLGRIFEVHQAALLEGIESCSKRLRDIFKSNMKAYRALICHGKRKGTFRLNLA